MMKPKYGEAMTQARDHADAILLDKAQMSAFLDVQSKLLKQFAEIGTAWTALASETMSSGSNLTRNLVQCRDPNQAIRLCNEWLGQRAQVFMNESQRVTGLWIGLYQSAVPPEAAAPTTAGESRSGSARSVSKS